MISISFLQKAVGILAETQNGLSGPQIVEFCNDWAVKANINIPHAIYPFQASNKRTALLENVRRFPENIQLKMLQELCEHHRISDQPKIIELRKRLDELFVPVINVATPLKVEREIRKFAEEKDFQIFLCHASSDKENVRRIYKWLKTEGFNPWLDEEDLRPGQDWDFEIRKAVKKSAIVLVCLSASSVGKTGYVQREIKLALDTADEQPEGTIFIIPGRLEDCELPERLKKYHRSDLFKESDCRKLVETLKTEKVRWSKN